MQLLFTGNEIKTSMKISFVNVALEIIALERYSIVIIYRVTWVTFKLKIKKIKTIHSQKDSYISGNGTF